MEACSKEQRERGLPNTVSRLNDYRSDGFPILGSSTTTGVTKHVACCVMVTRHFLGFLEHNSSTCHHDDRTHGYIHETRFCLAPC